jgi:hypothetical protein
MKSFIFKTILVVLFASFCVSCSVDVPNEDGSGSHQEYATDDGLIPTTPPPPPPPFGIHK